MPLIPNVFIFIPYIKFFLILCYWNLVKMKIQNIYYFTFKFWVLYLLNVRSFSLHLSDKILNRLSLSTLSILLVNKFQRKFFLKIFFISKMFLTSKNFFSQKTFSPQNNFLPLMPFHEFGKALTKPMNDLKRPETAYNDLKRPTTNRERPETSYNEQ